MTDDVPDAMGAPLYIGIIRRTYDYLFIGVETKTKTKPFCFPMPMWNQPNLATHTSHTLYLYPVEHGLNAANRFTTGGRAAPRVSRSKRTAHIHKYTS